MNIVERCILFYIFNQSTHKILISFNSAFSLTTLYLIIKKDLAVLDKKPLSPQQEGWIMKKQLLMKKTLPLLRTISLHVGFIILVSSVTVHAELIFSDDFHNNQGWTLGNEWAIGPASPSSGQTGGNGDPATDHTPDSVNGLMGAVLGGNVSTVLHDFYWTTSPAIDCTGYMNVNMEYYRWLNSDYAPYMVNKIDVFDGTIWQNVWLTGASPAVQDSAWTLQQFDVSSYADGNADFKLRFGYAIESGGVWTVSGWNIDDISVSGDVVPIPAAVWLLGSGIIALVGLKRKLKK